MCVALRVATSPLASWPYQLTWMEWRMVAIQVARSSSLRERSLCSPVQAAAAAAAAALVIMPQ